MVRLLAVLSLLGACAAAQTTVEGTVFDAVTGTGMSGIMVALAPVSREKPYQGKTDSQGHFVIEAVKPGAYQLFHTVPRGYFESPAEIARVFQVAEGDTSKRLEVRLYPQPRIAGRVVDGNDHGVANVRLEIVGRMDPPVSTDGTGKFELRLNPGAYTLSVIPPTDLKPPDQEPDSGRVMVWTRTYYPGVVLLESASKIVLRFGADLSGLEIKLAAVPAHAIRGVLLNPDGTPAPKAAVTLGVDQDDRGQPVFRPDPARTLKAESNSDGAFEFPQVVDGEWRLAAKVERGGEDLRAARWIEMTGHELDGVKLSLAPPFTVRGQAMIETPKGMPTPDPFPVFLVQHSRSLRNDTGMSNWMLWPEFQFNPSFPANLQGAAETYKEMEVITTDLLSGELGAITGLPHADGNFSMENVYSGSYRIISMMPPPPYYMAAVRVGQTELITAEVELSTGAIPITVVYKTDGGTVRGIAEKCASGVVLLIPQDPALQTVGFLRSSRCDSSDHYDFAAVRPGDYHLLAIATKGGIPPLDNLMLGQATKITVRSNEAASMDLRAIPEN
jgi:Carboxypeptidase regulatory-like domain